jgi:hypothetical protein
MEKKVAPHTLYIGQALRELERLFCSHDGPLSLGRQAALLAGGVERLQLRREEAKLAGLRIELAETQKSLAKRRGQLKDNVLKDEWLARMGAELSRCRMLLHPID